MAEGYSIDILIDSVINKEILEKIRGKKVFLYDFTPQSKLIMEYLFRNDIYVFGFLLENDRRDYANIKYFNKGMFYFDELTGNEIIIDVFGENLKLIKDRTNCLVYSLFKKEQKLKSVIIYGAGIGGELLNSFSKDFNIFGVQFIKFCDKDKSKQGLNYFGLEVISPEELKENYYDIDVIVSIVKKDEDYGR